MQIKTLNDAVRIANICEKYKGIDIDAMCETKRYIVDAKSIMGLSILMNGGEICFQVHGDMGTIRRFNEEIRGLEEHGEEV